MRVAGGEFLGCKTIMSGKDPCILCGSRIFQKFHERGPWEYRLCRGCGLVSLYPPPESRALEKGYWSYLPEDPAKIRAWERMMEPVIGCAVRQIETSRRGARGRVLDVGCGYGFFLAAMRAKGWEAEGVELSPTGRRYALDHLGLRVYSRPLEELRLPADSYDVVTLFYVIEHLPDPLKTLREVHRILAPGGLLLIRWPHTTPIVKALGPLSRRLDLYHTPFHLLDFSPGTISLALRSSGFTRMKTGIAGNTRDPRMLHRLSSIVFAGLAEILSKATAGKVLLPGVTKTTLAVKRLSKDA